MLTPTGLGGYSGLPCMGSVSKSITSTSGRRLRIVTRAAQRPSRRLLRRLRAAAQNHRPELAAQGLVPQTELARPCPYQRYFASEYFRSQPDSTALSYS